MIVIGQLWGAQCFDHHGDVSKLGVVVDVDIKMATGKLRLLSCYWPVTAAPTDTPGRMWNSGLVLLAEHQERR